MEYLALHQILEAGLHRPFGNDGGNKEAGVAIDKRGAWCGSRRILQGLGDEGESLLRQRTDIREKRIQEFEVLDVLGQS